MKKVASGLCALLLVGCASTGEARPVDSWAGMIEAEEHDDMRAAANVNAGIKETVISVALAGDANGAVRPWHVHEGTCGSGGAPVGQVTDYPPIRVGATGNGDATARLRIGLDPAGSYYVNIHESSTNLGDIVGCMQLST
ncbi:MAG: hypothetical protein ABFS34_00565 [Gemmatimonadota bacterium]